MGASSRQVGQYRRRRGRFNDGVIRQGTRDASSRTVAITAKGGQDQWRPRHVRVATATKTCTFHPSPMNIVRFSCWPASTPAYAYFDLSRVPMLKSCWYVFSWLRLFTRLHICLKMSRFYIHLRFASSTISVLATYDYELRRPGDTGIARG